MDRLHTLSWSNLRPVVLRRQDGSKVALDLAIQYEIVHLPDDRERGPYKVSTRGYMHVVETPDEAEVLAFHWHPGGGHVVGPHVHVGSTQLNPAGVLTKKVHIPSPRMSVEETIRFCITELKVEYLRDDWVSVLADSEDLFRMWRSWHTTPAPAPESKG